MRRVTARAALAALVSSAALALPAASAQVFAQSPARDEPPAPPAGRPARRAAVAGRRLMHALNLTTEQRADIARIRRETETEMRAIGQRLRRARRSLEEAIYATAVEESAVERRAAEVAAAEAERVRLRAQTELRIRRLLTPEQLAAFRELRQRAALRQRRDRQNRTPSAPRPAPRTLP